MEAGGEPQQDQLHPTDGLLRPGARALGAPPQPQQVDPGSSGQHHPPQEAGGP